MQSAAKLLGVLSLAGTVGFGSLAQAADTGPASDPGAWQKHEMRFTFLGFTSTYSCDGLADKLKRLLIVAGARPDVKSFPGACAAGFGRPDKFAAANLVFYTLTPPAADAVGAAPKLSGTWRPVQFTARSPRELELGDCELIEQFRDKLLPLFTARNVDDHTSCIPHQLSGSNIDLKFEAFVQDTHGTVSDMAVRRARDPVGRSAQNQ